MRTLGGWANENEVMAWLHPASAGPYTPWSARDDELSSSPAGRDAWARAGTTTGCNLAVSGKAAWFGHQYRRESSVGWSGPGGDDVPG
jgi:hypothetical protein